MNIEFWQTYQKFDERETLEPVSNINKQIEEAESSLNISFPETFKTWLAQHPGGNIDTGVCSFISLNQESVKDYLLDYDHSEAILENKKILIGYSEDIGSFLTIDQEENVYTLSHAVDSDNVKIDDFKKTNQTFKQLLEESTFYMKRMI